MTNTNTIFALNSVQTSTALNFLLEMLEDIQQQERDNMIYDDPDAYVPEPLRSQLLHEQGALTKLKSELKLAHQVAHNQERVERYNEREFEIYDSEEKFWKDWVRVQRAAGHIITLADIQAAVKNADLRVNGVRKSSLAWARQWITINQHTSPYTYAADDLLIHKADFRRFYSEADRNAEIRSESIPYARDEYDRTPDERPERVAGNAAGLNL
jgi:hypothetical protein